MVERLIQRILSKTDAGGKKNVWWPRPIDIARFWLEKSRGRTAP